MTIIRDTDKNNKNVTIITLKNSIFESFAFFRVIRKQVTFSYFLLYSKCLQFR